MADDKDTAGETFDKEEDHSTASKVSVKLTVKKTDANVGVNMNSKQHPEASVVAEVKAAVGADSNVGVHKTNIPRVSYPPKESKSPSETTSSKSLGSENSNYISLLCMHEMFGIVSLPQFLYIDRIIFYLQS